MVIFYVTKKVEGTKTDIDIISEVDYRSFLINYQRTTKLFASFVGKEFFYSKSEISKDGKLESICTTQKRDGEYFCEHTEEDNKKLGISSITYTTCMFYYNEPKGIKKVYSETHQNLATLETIGEGHYKLNLPDNKVNEYFYKEGQLQKVIIHRTLFTLQFLKRK